MNKYIVTKLTKLPVCRNLVSNYKDKLKCWWSPKGNLSACLSPCLPVISTGSTDAVFGIVSGYLGEDYILYLSYRKICTELNSQSHGFSFFVWYCVQLTRFVAILLNWGRGEQAAQAVPPLDGVPQSSSCDLLYKMGHYFLDTQIIKTHSGGGTA